LVRTHRLANATEEVSQERVSQRRAHIPKVDNGTPGTESLSTAEGSQRLRAALQRLESDEPAAHDTPAFGPMSHADRIQLNFRHAELHLSFLRY
jgi:hypothetical protein